MEVENFDTIDISTKIYEDIDDGKDKEGVEFVFTCGFDHTLSFKL